MRRHPLNGCGLTSRRVIVFSATRAETETQEPVLPFADPPAGSGSSYGFLSGLRSSLHPFVRNLSSIFLGDPPPDPRFLASLGALSLVGLAKRATKWS
jgi:hypothetical protein